MADYERGGRLHGDSGAGGDGLLIRKGGRDNDSGIEIPKSKLGLDVLAKRTREESFFFLSLVVCCVCVSEEDWRLSCVVYFVF